MNGRELLAYAGKISHQMALDKSGAEYEKFKREFNLNIRYHPTKTISDLASVIKGCRLFIGNQSFAFSLAEAMKVPRILEIHHHCPNCMPLSSNARIILTEKILKHTFSIKKSLLGIVKSGLSR